ncbi:MAG TPA: hypothetical protein VN228_01270 [Pyrinomonadaceae bacterium]|nr:hypothetical protein [Pyrinomonadaceae bacterium]
MTKKNLAALVLVLTAALTAAAQQPAGWVKFSPAGSSFTVLMPTEPKADTKTAQSPHGPYTTNLFSSVTPAREIYMVGWVDYDPKFNFGVQAELEANRDNFVKNVKAKLLSSTPIKLGTHPGIEFKAELTGQADIVSRVYVVGRRPYQLIIVSPAGRASAADRERFFSSFQLDAAK